MNYQKQGKHVKGRPGEYKQTESSSHNKLQNLMPDFHRFKKIN